jgi:hypothetical protein
MCHLVQISSCVRGTYERQIKLGSISNRLLHINVQQMYLVGKNSIDNVLPNIDQLALVSYLKAMTIQHTVELLRCMP